MSLQFIPLLVLSISLFLKYRLNYRKTGFKLLLVSFILACISATYMIDYNLLLQVSTIDFIGKCIALTSPIFYCLKSLVLMYYSYVKANKSKNLVKN